MLRRTPLKRGNSQLKRGPLKKVSDRAKAAPKPEVPDTVHMMQFFDRLRKLTPMDKFKDYETGERLPYVTNNIYFHHVLPKETYPQFKYSAWNIVFVSWATHAQYHDYPDKCPRIQAKYLELLSKIDTLVA